jgi:hypothetical protein
MHFSDSPISNMSKHSPSPFFPWLMLSLDHPKPHVVAYEEIISLSTFSLWFPIFQSSTLNHAIFHLVISAMLCYP